jgi:septal ring factor EnvC (AmiA/AmiB activator)
LLRPDPSNRRLPMSSHTLSRLRRRATPSARTSTGRALLAAALVLAAGSCSNPRTEAAMVQELNDAANEIGAMKGDIGQLQNDLDSLRQVVAKQDTVISRLVEVTHVPR